MSSLGHENNTISLQELCKEPLLAIPPHYIQLDHQESFSSPSHLMPAIPIVDMASMTVGQAKDFELQKLHSSCKEWGVFQVVNHGVSSSVVEKLKYEIEEFYKLPLEEKMRYKLRPGDVEGYGQTIANLKDQKIDWADRFLMVINPIHKRNPHLLSELPSSLREAMEAYFKESQKLAMVLFKLIGQALEIDKREMEDMFEDGLQLVRMTYYPPCPQPELVVGLRPHSDAGGLTILLQVNGVQGLQVKKNGVWIPVNILPDAFVVHIGDAMEIFSNGIYKSIVHRATVNSVKERISIGMFFNPKLEMEIGPATSLINEKNPPQYKRMPMEQYVKDFFSRKLRSKTIVDQMRIKGEQPNTE
ncbi:oxoglutarate-dependent flavonoid 7-O-demethylase 1-like [Coffea arabica]|uniref:Oxoglutarate-dependent flavonoid 7-O-demethylase 1-like n=1 Tax=Coffea arabica TaxID=13443 RepID=A0A6P6UEL7_COFAR